jgi:DNA-binding PadR family transcriptional regulator
VAVSSANAARRRSRYYYAMRYISERSSDPGLLVLSSLAEGPKHGYAISRDVEALAGVKLGPGTLYGALSRLEEKGMIEALPAEARRRPYRLTSEGAATLSEQLQMLSGVVRTGLERLRIAAQAA